MATKRATVTGSGAAVGVERFYPEGKIALSAAITLGSGVSLARGEATFYVRDEEGEPYGRVEVLAGGLVEVHRTHDERWEG